MEPSGLRAVVTGDIVRSSDLPGNVRRGLPDTLHSAYDAVQQTSPDALPYDVGITGGDGWQWYVHHPQWALARSLQFWTLLFQRGLSSRMVLAVDAIDFVSENNINESDGPAFRRSGRLLSALSDNRRFTCTIPEDAPLPYHVASDSIGELIDHFLHQWTEAQAQALSGQIRTVGTEDEITQTEIAANWAPEPITRQTVNRHLQRAHWDRLERTLARFERLIASLSN